MGLLPRSLLPRSALERLHIKAGGIDVYRAIA
jgi:hypothetical protein